MLNFNQIKRTSILATLLLLVTIDVYSTVYQTISDGKWNKNTTWTPSIPPMTWGFTDTVYVSHDVKLVANINIYGYVVVNTGSSIYKTSKTITVKENATLINNGTLDIRNLTFDWGSTIGINNGLIELKDNFLSKEGTFVNNGTMEVGGNFTNSTSGIFTNNGIIEVEGNFKNKSTFTSTGDIEVEGNFINDWSASFTTTGNIYVESDMTNRGTASLGNKVEVEGNFRNDWAATLTVSDTLEVDGNIINRGPMTNSGYVASEDFTNEAQLTSTGTTDINGDMLNKSDITNSGTFTIEGNFENKWSSTSFDNDGNFIVEGNVDNNGYIDNAGILYIVGDLDNSNQIDNNGNMYVDASVSGGGDIDGAGSLCNSDGTTDPTGGAKANNVTCDICNAGVNTLPVQLLSFEVELVNEKKVNIAWATATEENNDYFEVLRSTDGYNFKVVATVDGNGNSNTILYYQAEDYNAEVGVNYYQLKQVDFDGKTTLSSIVFVNINSDLKEIKLYPNPIQAGAMLNISISEETNASIEIYDMSGRLIKQVNTQSGLTQISTSEMQKGIYLLKMVEGEQSVVKRFVVN